MAFVGVISMTSCSESDGEEGEYDNWEKRNEAYFNSIYTQAETAINSGDNSWKIIRTYTKDELTAKAKTDFIVVHVETEGTGTESPIYSDKVRVHYRGNYMPSASYKDGYQFDSSWTGEYNLKAMIPKEFSISDVVKGFSTALMNMHKGDRWTVYIPYTLGYGASDFQKSSSSPTIPGYSTLRFDLTLVDYIHAGETFSTFQ